MDPDKTYARFRDYLKHEDSIINWRLTWNLALQTAFFAAFGWLAKKGEIADEMARFVAYARVGTILMGLCIGAATFIGVLAAQRAAHHLVRKWREYIKDNPLLDSAAFPPLAGGGSDFATRYGRWASVASVVTLHVAWLVILGELTRLVLVWAAVVHVAIALGLSRERFAKWLRKQLKRNPSLNPVVKG